MTIVTKIDALRTAVDNLKTDVAAADGSTAVKAANRDLASRLAEDADAVARGRDANRARARAAQAGQ